MPFLALLFSSTLSAALLSILGSMVGRVLVSLGIGAVTYVGVDLSLAYFKNGVVSSFSGLPSNIMGMLALMQVGSCISMVFSAMLMRMTFNGLTSGNFTQWVKK